MHFGTQKGTARFVDKRENHHKQQPTTGSKKNVKKIYQQKRMIRWILFKAQRRQTKLHQYLRMNECE